MIRVRLYSKTDELRLAAERRARRAEVAAVLSALVAIVAALLLLTGCGDVDQFGQADVIVRHGTRVACTYDPSSLGICVSDGLVRACESLALELDGAIARGGSQR